MSGATKQQLLRTVCDIEKGNVAHTLAYCLFWSQHATHERDGRPIIYKTGPEIAADLPVSARTANEHLKALAAKGYWVIEYRPKPGGVGKVTWLHFAEQALALVSTAATVDLSTRRRSRKGTFAGAIPADPDGADGAPPMSENATSNQTNTSVKTAQKKGFILTGDQGKLRMKESFQNSSGKQGKGDELRAPKWLKVSNATEHIANLVSNALVAGKLPDWEWSSQYPWRNLEEIERKLRKRGLETRDQHVHFLVESMKHWGWLRFTLDDRYAHHKSNVHRPSPLALAHGCDTLLDKLESKWADEAKQAAKNGASDLDEDLWA